MDGYNLDSKNSLNLTLEEIKYRNGMIAIVSFSTVGFMFSYYWIHVGRIKVGVFCDIQGILINLGDVSSAFWTFVICIHTYMIVVHSYEYPHIVLSSVISVWLINIIIIVSMASFYFQRDSPPFFASAGGSWCWISDQYKRKTDHRVYKKALQSVNKKLIWYPFVYFTLVFPLALQRIYTLSGRQISEGYLILAACIFSSAGLVNAIIYGITRHLVSIPKLRHRRTHEGIFSNDFSSSRLTSRTSTQIINSNKNFVNTTQQIQVSSIKSKSSVELSDQEMNTDEQ
ncbi:2015_t:CDS:2 [Diversispora eburnea]|uniref:2015_t:CDS:1 n=1 Tax=Diversispora eburnea TaxID=1213867 RepID=A0A9N9FQZ2_9GLOM|nr:2015_t:CDS:2 [Diversispora eburnea]